jgi:hypothetical protein
VSLLSRGMSLMGTNTRVTNENHTYQDCWLLNT